GRIYDYELGRFLNVDPIIGNPASSQSLNPYSYIGNNPLSGVDPTGYQCVGSHIESQTCEGTGAAVVQVADHSHDTQVNNGSSPGQGTQTRTPQQQEAPNLGNTAIQAPKVASQGADAPQ